MKGQMVYEFVIASLFFFGIMLYTINFLNMNVSAFSETHDDDIYKSRAWQISEVVLRDRGEWSGSVPGKIGLAQNWPVLNESNLNDFHTWCQGREEEMYSLLDADPHYNGFNIEVFNQTAAGEDLIVSCGKNPDIVKKADVLRIAVGDKTRNLYRVIVTYW